MTKKSKTKKKTPPKTTTKKKQFILSDDELDQVSGGTGVTLQRVVVRPIAATGISIGGSVMEPVGSGGGEPTPMRSRGGSFGGQQL